MERQVGAPTTEPRRASSKAWDWKPAIILAVACCFALLCALLRVWIGHTYPLTEFDSLQRAGSARQLLETGQWSALTLRSWELVGHEHVATDRPWPVQCWSLGYPLLLAAGFAIFGVSDAVVIGLPILGYVGCVILVFLLARRLWNLRIATFALILAVTGGDTLVHWSAGSHLESVYTFFLLAMILALLTRPIRLPMAFSGGVLLGIAYFIRPTALAWLPMLVLVGVGVPAAVRRRALVASGAGLAVMIVISITLVRVLSPAPLPTTGPSISYTRQILIDQTSASGDSANIYPGQVLNWSEVLSNWPQLIRKLMRGAREAVANVSGLFPTGLILLAPIGILAALKEVKGRALAGGLVVTLALGFGGTIITAYWCMARYAAVFGPLLTLFAALGIDWAWNRLRHYVGTPGQIVFLLLALVVIVGPVVGAVLPVYQVYSLPESYYLSQQVASLIPRQAIVASQRAADIAWRSRQRGIVITYLSPEQILQIDDKLIKLDVLVLEETPALGQPVPENIGPFQKIATVAAPWRLIKGQMDYHHYAVYRREPER